MRTQGRRRGRHDYGVWEALRPLRRKLRAQQNHPHYVTRPFKEQPLLEELIARDPPVGGMDAYVADLNREEG